MFPPSWKPRVTRRGHRLDEAPVLAAGGEAGSVLTRRRGEDVGSSFTRWRGGDVGSSLMRRRTAVKERPLEQLLELLRVLLICPQGLGEEGRLLLLLVGDHHLLLDRVCRRSVDTGGSGDRGRRRHDPDDPEPLANLPVFVGCRGEERWRCVE